MRFYNCYRRCGINVAGTDAPISFTAATSTDLLTSFSLFQSDWNNNESSGGSSDNLPSIRLVTRKGSRLSFMKNEQFHERGFKGSETRWKRMSVQFELVGLVFSLLYEESVKGIYLSVWVRSLVITLVGWGIAVSWIGFRISVCWIDRESQVSIQQMHYTTLYWMRYVRIYCTGIYCSIRTHHSLTPPSCSLFTELRYCCYD
jgi:hypothetical protein